MSWSKYAEFPAFAAVLIVVPGADFAVVTNGGRRRAANRARRGRLAAGLPVQHLVLARSHAVLSLCYLLVLVTGLHSARRLLTRRKVRRALDATTGVVLLGFGARLATERV